MGAVFAAVGGDYIGSAEDHVFAIDGGGGSMRHGGPIGVTIGSIARGIRGTEESDDRSAEGDGKMQRTGVAADHTNGVAQEGHELAEFAVEEKRIGVTAGVANFARLDRLRLGRS